MLESVYEAVAQIGQGTQLIIALGLTLIVGAMAARVAKMFGMPTVTGFIAVGMLIGPYGLGVLSHELVTEHLRVFADIALMIIAFSIGRMLDFRFSHIGLRRPIIIPACESMGAFILVTVAVILASRVLTMPGQPPDAGFMEFILPLALLLGALAMDTAPASSLVVVKDFGGETLLTRCLMMSVAVDNALAITMFGVVQVLVLDVFMAGTSENLLAGVLLAVARILGALLWGALVAVLLHPLIERQSEHGPLLMLTLGTVLFCTGVSSALGFPPILSGIALGTVMSNSYRADRHAFEALERFEPPLFAIFFVIAGAHFDFAAFSGAAVVLAIYMGARLIGKFLGARLATKALGAEDSLHHYMGLTLVPQGAIAIGLVFILQSIPEFEPFWSPVTTIILTAVALTEMLGPAVTHWALHRSDRHNCTETDQDTAADNPGANSQD